MLLSIFFFILAGLAEIGGGYLVWLYMRDDKSPVYLLAGAIILFLYGIIPTFQPEASFGKVYAAYGGVFIALSILWGWLIDGLRPDTYDIIGGECLIASATRNGHTMIVVMLNDDNRWDEAVQFLDYGFKLRGVI